MRTPTHNTRHVRSSSPIPGRFLRAAALFLLPPTAFVFGQTNPSGTTLPAFTANVSGANGANGSAGIGSSAATPGLPGGAITFTNNGTIATSSTAVPPILLVANGGNGGNGDSALIGNDVAPAPGGNGGSVAFASNGTLSMGAINAPAVISLSAVGGTGGSSATAALVPAPGGSGGTINFTNTANLQPGGSPANLILAVADGGTSGSAANGRTNPTATGGSGGTVTLNHQSGTLTLPAAGTTSAPVYGLYASASGGQGGPGTAAGSGLLQYGSAGGIGGAGGQTTLTIGGAVAVPVANAIGVFASASGGVGGVGGSDTTFINQAPGNGGAGGGAGIAQLWVSSSASITTSAANTTGVLLQAFGGNGGNGGNDSGTLITTGGSGGMGANVTNSGTQPSVDLDNSGTISATASYSPAVILQSVGGTGGNGSPLGNSKGGRGGNGGSVYGQNSGTITTNGAYDFGIFAQSVGGTGGNGGPGAGLNFGGGNGGNSGLAGSVEIQNLPSGSITTVGDGASAIVAQSVGGGNATNAFAAADFSLNVVTPSNGGGNGGNSSSFFFGARGGNGGSGGNGGNVFIGQAGTVSTNGALAYGVFAQSVGGGGGNGGSASAWGLGYAIALGGGGGGGGDAGAVSLVSNGGSGSVSTSGLSSPALFLQSIGGAGGVGDGASAYSLGVITDFSIAIGGAGGLGGDGGPVFVSNNSVLNTQSINSPGIVALSVGEGGGTAGQADSVAIAMGVGTIPGISYGLAVGGSGGQGGDGAAVTVTNTAAITTQDAQSHAIKAMSTGGGGGDGANAAAATLPLGVSTKVPSISVGTAVGGSGGSGGSGGNITVTNSAALSTAGFAADGIHAVSTGGGGGDGSIGSASTFAGSSSDWLQAAVYGGSLILSPGTTFSVHVGVGGSGGVAGDGGVVTITSSNAISTQGFDSRGIFAHSIGGGGGDATGGNASGSFNGQVNVAVGGSGGVSGNGGNVTVNNWNFGQAISTVGDGSHAIEGQSVGGGGGSGGTAAAGIQQSGLLLTLKTSIENAFKEYGGGLLSVLSQREVKFTPSNLISLGADIAVGGSGGADGDGGQVNLNNEGNLTTQGNIAYGIFGESVGGGGGTGGAGSTFGGKVFSVNLALGGTGSAGGNGGDVSIGNSTNSVISTQGSGSFGIFAHSIGGGGGAAGAASDDTNLSYALTLSVGGNGQASGNGGNIDAVNSGTIQTTGFEAHGLVGESVGGGGGLMFLNLYPTNLGGGASNTNPSPTLSLNIGGFGGAGGNGGTVSLTHSGTIQTSGQGAFGIYGLSVGGGGGFGTQGSSSRNFAVTGNIGGGGGAVGNGGSVGVGFAAGYNGASPTITTSGNGAAAVFLQSIGGGGGYSGSFSSDSSIGFSNFLPASGGAGGNGGFVSVVTLTGASLTINTTGAAAHGLYLQSLGGGGGTIGTGSGLMIPLPSNGIARTGATGTGGPIQVNTTGTIYTLGSNSVGIYAQSGVQLTDGTIGTGGGNITISHNGTIGGGSGSGAAIQIDGGANNNISLSGGAFYARSGTAIIASTGNDTVINSGRLIGNVNLGTGTNQLINAAGGTLRPGTSLNLGGGNFTNSGTMAIFNDGPGATTVNGSFTQTAGGQWQVYVDYSQGKADLLTVTGPVSLSGTIYPIINALPATVSPGGLPALPIISGSQISTSNLTFLNTLAFTYSLSSGPTANLQANVNFAPAAVLNDPNLTPSLQAAALGLQNTWTAGNLGALQPEFFALAAVNSVPTYESILANYATEGAAAQAAGVASTATQLQSSLHSFPAFVGTSTRLTEEGGGYVRFTGTSTRQDRAGWNTGYDQTARTVQAGGQRPFAPGWFGGAAFGYTDLDLDADDRRFSSRGHRYDVGGVLKRIVDERWLFAASLGYGYGDSDAIRLVERSGQKLALTSTARFHSVSGRLRGAWHLDGRHAYLRPSIDLDLTSVTSPAHHETGDIRYAMAFDRNQDWTIAVTPAIETGVRLDLGKTVGRGYVSLGESVANDRSWSRGAHLIGASASGAPFASRYGIDDTLTQVTVGLDLITQGRLELKAEYRGQFGSGTSANTASGRLAYRF